MLRRAYLNYYFTNCLPVLVDQEWGGLHRPSTVEDPCCSGALSHSDVFWAQVVTGSGPKPNSGFGWITCKFYQFDIGWVLSEKTTGFQEVNGSHWKFVKGPWNKCFPLLPSLWIRLNRSKMIQDDPRVKAKWMSEGKEEKRLGCLGCLGCLGFLEVSFEFDNILVTGGSKLFEWSCFLIWMRTGLGNCAVRPSDWRGSWKMHVTWPWILVSWRIQVLICFNDFHVVVQSGWPFLILDGLFLNYWRLLGGFWWILEYNPIGTPDGQMGSRTKQKVILLLWSDLFS